MRFYAALICFLIASLSVEAQTYNNGQLQVSQNAVNCPPVTGTLASASDTVSLTCMGAPSYEILITPNASTPIIGTIQAYDPVSGSARALFKAGVGELDVSTAPMTGTTGAVLYRLVSFNGGAIKLSSYTSGSATVQIWASYATSGVFPNNPFHTSEEGALRNGRAYSASTGIQAVAAGNNLSFNLVNPSSAGLRLVITNRILACDLATGNTAGQYFGISNATVNLPATAATITNRRTGGAASVATATYGVATTRPDTTTTTANPLGGVLPTGGITYQIPGMRTVEPGTSFANWIGGKSTGLGVAQNCSIIVQWYEENVN